MPYGLNLSYFGNWLNLMVFTYLIWWTDYTLWYLPIIFDELTIPYGIYLSNLICLSLPILFGELIMPYGIYLSYLGNWLYLMVFTYLIWWTDYTLRYLPIIFDELIIPYGLYLSYLGNWLYLYLLVCLSLPISPVWLPTFLFVSSFPPSLPSISTANWFSISLTQEGRKLTQDLSSLKISNSNWTI